MNVRIRRVEGVTLIACPWDEDGEPRHKSKKAPVKSTYQINKEERERRYREVEAAVNAAGGRELTCAEIMATVQIRYEALARETLADLHKFGKIEKVKRRHLSFWKKKDTK